MKNIMYSNNFLLSIYKAWNKKFSRGGKLILSVLAIVITVPWMSEALTLFLLVYIIFLHNMRIDIEELKTKNLKYEAEAKQKKVN